MKEFLDYLVDIIEAMQQAMNFTENLEYKDFLKDDKTTSAVIRKLEIIGEAVKKIPNEIQEKVSSNSLERNGWHER